VELAGVAPVAAEDAERLTGFAVNNADEVVLSVGVDQKALVFVVRKCDRSDAAIPKAFTVEDLNAVVVAIADIYEAVRGESHAVDPCIHCSRRRGSKAFSWPRVVRLGRSVFS
jgi:hypothetical protein